MQTEIRIQAELTIMTTPLIPCAKASSPHFFQ
jgi:hypothetical protein